MGHTRANVSAYKVLDVWVITVTVWEADWRGVESVVLADRYETTLPQGKSPQEVIRALLLGAYRERRRVDKR